MASALASTHKKARLIPVQTMYQSSFVSHSNIDKVI